MRSCIEGIVCGYVVYDLGIEENTLVWTMLRCECECEWYVSFKTNLKKREIRSKDVNLMTLRASLTLILLFLPSGTLY